MPKKPVETKETKATAKPAPKKPTPVVEEVPAAAKAPRVVKPKPAPKAPAFNAEKFESDKLPHLAVLARTRGEDQVHEGATVHQDGSYTAPE